MLSNRGERQKQKAKIANISNKQPESAKSPNLKSKVA